MSLVFGGTLRGWRFAYPGQKRHLGFPCEAKSALDASNLHISPPFDLIVFIMLVRSKNWEWLSRLCLHLQKIVLKRSGRVGGVWSCFGRRAEQLNFVVDRTSVFDIWVGRMLD